MGFGWQINGFGWPNVGLKRQTCAYDAHKGTVRTAAAGEMPI
jgi:hypothetical protein